MPTQPMPTGGLELIFACNGVLTDEPDKAHSEDLTVTDLTGLFNSGNPICTEEGCSQFDDELEFIGWKHGDGSVITGNRHDGFYVSDHTDKEN